ncbi:MAG: hypothetical protein Q8P23_02495 [bacterium]|nr:hypothetical protein [bacterium]
MTIKFEGELEIDQARGVIYFHDELGITLLRISRLPTPIPSPKTEKPDVKVVPLGDTNEDYDFTPLDITHMHGASWHEGYYEIQPEDVGKRYIEAFGLRRGVGDFIGTILGRDVGKRVYLRDGVLQVENDEQYAVREMKRIHQLPIRD